MLFLLLRPRVIFIPPYLPGDLLLCAKRLFAEDNREQHVSTGMILRKLVLCN